MARCKSNLDPAVAGGTDRLRRDSDLSRRHLDRQERCSITTRPKPRVTTPQEHHVRVQPVMTRHRRDRRTRLKRLGDNPPLERLRVAPPLALAPVRQDKCPRKLSGHDRPQSREDLHAGIARSRSGRPSAYSNRAGSTGRFGRGADRGRSWVPRWRPRRRSWRNGRLSVGHDSPVREGTTRMPIRGQYMPFWRLPRQSFGHGSSDRFSPFRPRAGCWGPSRVFV